ncbi:Substrate-binding region of ABC-type glycine betaine transport system [Candidatus Terasakiella magnetica]|uniref:Substrate-binding region of ABC-type glycine betaine transport system n=1 Tax=Candidatus Terasakiella magnetica TaxID=1867952 RepID=A0A1C3RJ85_9PROT|nr:ABC transporter substrate-binding protein [Candidatus Terasakiella magnetica]SCA57332.1 Substrate-binding region of ABC-type glycine betaine transport system [Candidatus Terasakiella magnetica]
MKKMMIGAMSLVAALATSQAAEACGKVTIADMNWSSAELMANVDMFILKNGYGCDAELVPGDTMPTGTSMIEKGEPDVAPEMWTNSFPQIFKDAGEGKKLRIAGKSLSDGGEEGFWVPEYLVKQNPELATIEGIMKNAKMFKHPEDPDLGAFYGCPAGWGCQISSGHLFKSLKLADAGFDYVDPGSGAGLSGSIAKAYTGEKPWFGYYWAPTAVLGKYKMVMVDFGSGVDAEHFKGCLSQKDCEEPKTSMYPPSPVYTVTASDFASKNPQAYDYFTKRSFTNAQMNELLAWKEEEQADGGIAAEHFIKNYEAIWSKWVSGDAAAKLKKAANNL